VSWGAREAVDEIEGADSELSEEAAGELSEEAGGELSEEAGGELSEEAGGELSEEAGGERSMRARMAVAKRPESSWLSMTSLTVRRMWAGLDSRKARARIL
jgi:hypothetical protein